VQVTPDNLMLAENAALILPLHRELDIARESSNSVQALGTTKRGIGPAYEDKVGRRALRVVDLKDFAGLPRKIDRLLAHHNTLRRGSNLPEFDGKALLTSLKEIAPKILPFASCAWRKLDAVRREGKRILFEGAQAVLLDIDHGTYPYVTSSNTVAGQAAAGSGIGPRDIGYVLGIAKAYTTRVGEGPLPTENAEIADMLHAMGREFGATTGRPRRCGWFDSVATRHATMVNGIDELAITNIDGLDTVETIKVCIGYRDGGKKFDYIPNDIEILARVAPVYAEFPGWLAPTHTAKSFKQLPAKCRAYLKAISELTGAKLYIASVGPGRDQTIFV
jgi:adenylosuccinate synthase